jgi:transcriptional regulator with XRE-family HTH domain
MNSTTIKIDGSKLRSLLESTGKTIYQIATESGYSRNVISNAIRQGYASSAVQNIARLYGISPDDYKAVEIIKDPEPVIEELKGQISIDDLEEIKRDELKALIKEAIVETLNNIVCNEIAANYDPLSHTYTVALKVKKEALT